MVPMNIARFEQLLDIFSVLSLKATGIL